MSNNDAFLEPSLSVSTLDMFIVRQAILNALSSQLADFGGFVLDIGCGNMPYKPLLLESPSRVSQYIGLDIRTDIYEAPDLFWNGRTIPLATDSVDCAVATEVLEHTPNPKKITSEICRVLKARGLFFLTVPFLWPLHDVPYDEYRYTPYALERILSDAGFAQIRLQALGGWDASLAQMIGLWVRRRAMPKSRMTILSRLLLPIIRYLISRDHAPTTFGESTMITGVSGTAFKPRSS